jgi:hypothetical protein
VKFIGCIRGKGVTIGSGEEFTRFTIVDTLNAGVNIVDAIIVL